MVLESVLVTERVQPLDFFSFILLEEGRRIFIRKEFDCSQNRGLIIVTLDLFLLLDTVLITQQIKNDMFFVKWIICGEVALKIKWNRFFYYFDELAVKYMGVNYNIAAIIIKLTLLCCTF